MFFRQLYHLETGTYTYLLGCEQTRQAILIDPVIDNLPAYLQLIKELDLTLSLAIDTHVHADHITALGALRDQTSCITMMGEPSRSNCVSKTFKAGDTIYAGNLTLTTIHTPGHTEDSYCFLLKASPDQDLRENYLFSGDTLLIRGTGRTDFQNGSAKDQYHSLFKKILTLPDSTRVYPGHDYKGWTVSSIGEEKAHNPRLQVKSLQEYEQIMANLKLANPKYMDVAVPANLACGKIQNQ